MARVDVNLVSLFIWQVLMKIRQIEVDDVVVQVFIVAKTPIVVFSYQLSLKVTQPEMFKEFQNTSQCENVTVYGVQ